MNTTNTTPDQVHRVRVQVPNRRQIEWAPRALDQLIPSDHKVRSVWAYVERLDLSPLYQKFKAVQGHAGRDPVDPKILMALWLFATIEGVGSARELARLCERDLAYMWICGGVGVNYHLLSDFRTLHGEFLNQLLTDTIATLLHQGIVTLHTVAQDGMRVRAHAGGGSFRRRDTLERHREEAREQVERLHKEVDDQEVDTRTANAQQTAARERAARERLERIERALQDLEKIEAQKESKKKGSKEKARSSTTDPDARVMKMADGGFRPAYNVQFVTDGDSRIIVGVDVTNNGSDGGQMAPMYEDMQSRYEEKPENYLVDGGFATKDDITDVERQGTSVFAPVLKEEVMRARGTDPYARKPGDTDEVFGFRQRMATPEAKATYKRRSSIAEFPNAQCRNHGLQQFLVRGLRKVRAVALWHALVFNFERLQALGYC